MYTNTQNSNSTSITVSAIIPVKNGSQWLGECLESLGKQKLPPHIKLELSIYDDGSTDDSLQIANTYKQQLLAMPNMNIIIGWDTVSRGVGYAKNQAIRQCSGEYLLFCDADDISEPLRIYHQLEAALCSANTKMAFVGSGFRRVPSDSTKRFTKWANTLSEAQLYTQMFTSHGPTLIAPTWLISRHLYDSVGGFEQRHACGYPEDLRFFYDAYRIGAIFIRVDRVCVLYRYHPMCASFGVSEQTIWQMRVEAFEEFVLQKWPSFTIWNAGKQGKRFYRSLQVKQRSKVLAFCDVDRKKLERGTYEFYDPLQRTVKATIPIITIEEVKPPVVICVKLDLTNGDFERLLEEKHWIEGVDYYHFS